MRHIAVIGAGITGITTAYALQARGFDVTVFDRNRYAAMATSFANGGQLSASNAEVWNRWATVLKGLKWMLAPGAPLLVNPRPSLHKFGWMAEFMANIPKYRQNTLDTVRMAIAARAHLLEHAAAEGIDFACETRGILHVYHTKKEFDHATGVTALMAKGGLVRRAVSPEEIRAIEPTLKAPLYGGYYAESDFTGDIHAYARGLSAACVRRGATVRYGVTVDRLRHGADGVRVAWRDASGVAAEALFDGVVVAAGVESRAFARQLGDRVNIYPVKGYSITVALDDADSQAAAPWVSLLDDEAKVVSSRLGRNRFRIAGTAEFNGRNLDIRDDRIRPLVQWCEHLFPDVSTEFATPWAGLRPMMPDMMPRVGPGRRPGVFYNTGHGHLGWTLAAATAECVADAVAAAPARSKTPGPKGRLQPTAPAESVS
ncbi:MAG: D-amino acid dehydrogenase [Pseudomonadota bacterium]